MGYETFETGATDVKVAFAGDWHQNTHWLKKVFTYCAENEVNTIVQLGDFGYSPAQSFKYYLEELESLGKYYGITTGWLKGNHEHHSELQQLEPNNAGLVPLTDHVIYLPQGYRWEWDDVSFTVCGGAYSVDRSWRVEHVSWFREELITIQDAYKVCEQGHTDVLLTHDAPNDVKIPLSDGAWIPKDDLVKAHRHKDFLGKIVDNVTPHHIFHGHYHVKYDALRKDENDHVTMVHGLNKDNTSVTKNIIIPSSIYELGLDYDYWSSIGGEIDE